MDMRKALGINKYGTWPRQGDGNYFLRYENGTIYEGDFNGQNQKEGVGSLFAPHGFRIYEGQWKEDLPHGLGILYYKNGFKAFEG